MHYKVWVDIAFLFLNFNGASTEEEQFHPATLNNWCNYLSTLGLKLTDVSKRGPRGWTVVDSKGCYVVLIPLESLGGNLVEFTRAILLTEQTFSRVLFQLIWKFLLSLSIATIK